MTHEMLHHRGVLGITGQVEHSASLCVLRINVCKMVPLEDDFDHVECGLLLLLNPAGVMEQIEVVLLWSHHQQLFKNVRMSTLNGLEHELRHFSMIEVPDPVKCIKITLANSVQLQLEILVF